MKMKARLHDIFWFFCFVIILNSCSNDNIPASLKGKTISFSGEYTVREYDDSPLTSKNSVTFNGSDKLICDSDYEMVRKKNGWYEPRNRPQKIIGTSENWMRSMAIRNAINAYTNSTTRNFVTSTHYKYKKNEINDAKIIFNDDTEIYYLYFKNHREGVFNYEATKNQSIISKGSGNFKLESSPSKFWTGVKESAKKAGKSLPIISLFL